ncbi:hypothetical protein GCM10023264_26640 [Sphingomonas daechungensis]|uniref:DUF1109 domain-containing protein n=1 Tax=Sphingomonas daechungensis TaxID=1176646 RepID=A0ABX6T3X9_9SPHN|nr:DUF1109 domain-containing protein [Sphingomonas daechungensis]QNP43418.1 DUF1109 domain-containing protein [Sphingomonas daechungensis]
MRTEDLIADLAASPTATASPSRGFAVALAAGWIIALLGLVLFLGSPLSAVPNTGMLPFAVKTGFAVAFTAAAISASLAAGRPGQKLALRATLIAIPFAVLLALAILELTSTARSDWPQLFFRTTYATCITAIALASLPVLAAALWAYREMAPTRPALAGLLVGLSAGAAAAVAYALYCPETTAAFLLAAYTPAALVPALAGWLVGPKLLRW